MNGYGQRILLAVVIGTLLAVAAPAGAQQEQHEDKEHPRRGEGRRDREGQPPESGPAQSDQQRGERRERRADARPMMVERERVERPERAGHVERAERPRVEHEPARPRQEREFARQRDDGDEARPMHRDRPQPVRERHETDQRGPAWRDFDGIARERADADRARSGHREEARREEFRGDRGGHRLSNQQQTRLIESQRRQAEDYQRLQADSQQRAEHFSRTLRDQRRTSQYRYQGDYVRRLHDHRHRYATRRWDYYNDPFFYTPVSYRYHFGGYHYDTNRYGADLLRDAVRHGYEEGYWAGRADRMDGWRPDYRGSYAYGDASYGYQGYYVPYSAYRYYFRQGFRRGYEDGYHGGYRYGSYRRGTPAILPAILATILVLEALD